MGTILLLHIGLGSSIEIKIHTLPYPTLPNIHAYLILPYLTYIPYSTFQFPTSSFPTFSLYYSVPLPTYNYRVGPPLYLNSSANRWVGVLRRYRIDSVWSGLGY
jgi:hypothetical protein